MPHDRDASFIYDMLDSARSVQEMTRAVLFSGFVQDRKLYRAVEREIEILGEAANRVSDELKAASGGAVGENRRHPSSIGARVRRNTIGYHLSYCDNSHWRADFPVAADPRFADAMLMRRANLPEYDHAVAKSFWHNFEGRFAIPSRRRRGFR
ncbi:MAG: HepT-like ribonuclease domain-containing protein [Tepidisphaeraceae bacterium]|jgi:hypothetical protein